MKQKTLKADKKNPLDGKADSQKLSRVQLRAETSHDGQDPFALKMNEIMEAVVEAPNLQNIT